MKTRKLVKDIDEALGKPSYLRKPYKQTVDPAKKLFGEKEGRSLGKMAFLRSVAEHRVQMVEDIKRHLLDLVPKALAVKDLILSDHRQSVWLRDRTASDVLDRTLPKPQQELNIKGAIITGQYSKEELERVLFERLTKLIEGGQEQTK